MIPLRNETINSLPLRVVKLGGSTLESQNYDLKFMNWFSCLPKARTLLLVGGGPPVDALRHLASLRPYDDEFMHWLCIDAMDLSFRVAQQHLGDSWLGLNHADQLQAWLQTSHCSNAMVHVRCFYRADNVGTLPIDLPCNWDTTSDSLAALLAHIVSADELILVKSCSVTPPHDWQALSQAGIVDNAFPKAIKHIKTVCIASPDIFHMPK